MHSVNPAFNFVCLLACLSAVDIGFFCAFIGFGPVDYDLIIIARVNHQFN